MLAASLIVFREILEAALVVSIIAAATRGITGRGRLLFTGITAGVMGSILVALSAGEIARLASGTGQALFNAAVLSAAVILIAWHILWMSQHGREMAQALNAVSRAVRDGSRPPSALMMVVAIAVLREGSEIALFMYGMAAGGTSAWALAAGMLIGLLAGVTAGMTLYAGLLRIPVSRMFTATNWILLLVAAGMASQAAGFLVQADWLPALGTQVWNTSHIIADGSPMGHLLHALIGYQSRPAGIQILAFGLTLTIVFGASRMISRNAGTKLQRPSTARSS